MPTYAAKASGHERGPSWHHMSPIWQLGIKSINRYQVEPMRPIRLLKICIK